MRRRFARLAGLLELADAEFASIRTTLDEYKGLVVAEIREDPANVDLDLLSLRALYTIESSVKALDPMVAKAMRRKLSPDASKVPEIYIDRLAAVVISSVDELEKAATL